MSTEFKIFHLLDSLRTISLQTAREKKLIPGKKLCTSCRKLLYSDAKTLDEGNELIEVTDPEFSDNSFVKEQLDSSLLTLGCSPVKLVSQRDRVSYGKRKLSEVNQVTEKKLSDVLNVEISTASEVEKKCCDSKEDLEHLMQLIKSKFNETESLSERVKLMTLVPESWTIEHTQMFFETSRRSVLNSRSLKKSKGILGEVEKKAGRSISNELKESVFFMMFSTVFLKKNRVFLFPVLKRKKTYIGLTR